MIFFIYKHVFFIIISLHNNLKVLIYLTLAVVPGVAHGIKKILFLKKMSIF